MEDLVTKNGDLEKFYFGFGLEEWVLKFKKRLDIYKNVVYLHR